MSLGLKCFICFLSFIIRGFLLCSSLVSALFSPALVTFWQVFCGFIHPQSMPLYCSRRRLRSLFSRWRYMLYCCNVTFLCSKAQFWRVENAMKPLLSDNSCFITPIAPALSSILKLYLAFSFKMAMKLLKMTSKIWKTHSWLLWSSLTWRQGRSKRAGSMLAWSDTWRWSILGRRQR